WYSTVDVLDVLWEWRHWPTGIQIQLLLGDPRIAGSHVADVRNPLAQHERALEAHAERQSRPSLGIETAAAQYLRMDASALGELEPFALVSNVDLPSSDGVGVLGHGDPPLRTREDGLDQFLDHAEHVLVAGVARAADAPQVDLVRFSDVAAIDDVAPVNEPWSDDQLVDAGVPGICLQRGWQLGAHVTTQHDRWADVSGVPA